MRKILSISLIGCAFVAILYSSTTVLVDHDDGEMQFARQTPSLIDWTYYNLDAAFIAPDVWYVCEAPKEFGVSYLSDYENNRKLQEFKKHWIWLNRRC